MSQITEEYVLLYDGYCPTCNWSVNFIIGNEGSNKTMKFASLQSEFAEFIMKSDSSLRDIDSVILVGKKSGRIWVKSDAFLKVMSYLGGWYKLLTVFYIVPKFIRNFFYDLYAKNRYRFTGKYDVCNIPDKAIKERTMEFK
jgi:predicted DCC family thiol-disulfide oxidoreductase YuxK